VLWEDTIISETRAAVIFRAKWRGS